jgi:ParB family transcriptional regulator, chromosome partitioning protein
VQALQRGEPAPKPAPSRATDADIAALERELGATLGARVAVQHGRGGRGKLVIQYHSVDELEGILQRIRRDG